MPRSDKGQKPAKPYPEFPLFAHATRRWAKKIRGKFHYFGRWDDLDGALQKYLEQKDDLHAGRTPRTGWGGLTIRDLCNRFLTSKRHLVDTREIVERTWQDYYVVCNRVIRVFGPNRLVSDLAAEDFERLRADCAKTRGPVALGNDIQRVRILFKYGFDNGLIDRPVRYGSNFRKPSKKALRLALAAKGPRVFEASHIQKMFQAAGSQLRAMILLGINCGFGNQDCATLPLKALGLQGGWVDYHRPKTGVDRRCPLWPETVEALRVAISVRPKPKYQADEGLVFITSRRRTWAKTTADNPITKETVKLLKALGVHRPGVAFYALRHTFETIGGGSRDQVAVDYIMGHAPDSRDMSAVYRQRIDDDRLRAVTDHVHEWLFGSAAAKER